jgi:type II secretory ATPase GspE/PulE/Tfp pilus assembly ATPase PilB-like protein
LAPGNLLAVQELCDLPRGIVVVTGPTGCGKTTTLYSMLLRRHQPGVCIVTVEDPVECRFAGMGQMQLQHQVGLTFPRALRALLRQDPDILLVGEIRDLETLRIVAACALTGHLVLTALHTETAPGAIVRLLDVGLEPFLVGAALEGVIAQRLVRCLCPDCRRPAGAAPSAGLPAAARRQLTGACLYEPVGCPSCHGTGFRGRTAIHEVLRMSDRIRESLTTPGSLREVALAAGMQPMLQDGLQRVADGVTSLSEVLRVVPTTS